MKGSKIQKFMVLMAAVVLLSAIFACAAGAGELKVSYLYNLSDFTGGKPYSWAKVSVDETKNEIYVTYGESVTVFNGSGMEVFSFDYDANLGIFQDVVVDSTGDILLLTYKQQRYIITRCNFRAEPLATIELKELPQEYANFSPNRMALRDGRLYLTNMNTMQVVVTDLAGRFIKGFDLGTLLGFSEKERGDAGLGGLFVDRDGTLLFTLPAIARVFRLAPDGDVKSFGRRGSAPGKFGVVAGITVDRSGNYLVADILRCVVSVFDKNFNFVKEFGFRGFKAGNLIGPNDIYVDKDDKVYVSQLRKRGVSVYQISND